MLSRLSVLTGIIIIKNISKMTVQLFCCQRNAVNCVAGMPEAVHMQKGLVPWSNTSLQGFIWHLCLRRFKMFPSPKFYHMNWASTKGGWNVHYPVKPMLSQKLDSSIQFLQLGTIEICGSVNICCKGLFHTYMMLSGVPCFYPPGASRISKSDNQMCLLILPSALW